MKTQEEIFDILKAKFNTDIIELQNIPTEPIIQVSPERIRDICFFLRDDEQMKFNSIMLLSGADDANGEKTDDPEGGFTIKGGTLSVYYHLYSIELTHKITLKVSTPREHPEVVSVESVWKGADWHEREAYDMFGIKFLHHHNLKRILMPYDWEEGSHPLRKDYKNPEFYHGIKIGY